MIWVVAEWLQKWRCQLKSGPIDLYKAVVSRTCLRNAEDKGADSCNIRISAENENKPKLELELRPVSKAFYPCRSLRRVQKRQRDTQFLKIKDKCQRRGRNGKRNRLCFTANQVEKGK